MTQLKAQASASAECIVSKVGSGWRQPRAVIICGSGLGSLAEAIADPVEIPYSEIPHFRVSTVAGHASKLVYGTLRGVPILAMMGRFQYDMWSFSALPPFSEWSTRKARKIKGKKAD